MNNSKIKDIEEMVKAGFPCFYIYTEDESHVEAELRNLAESLEFEVATWTVNTIDLTDFLSGTLKAKARFNILINTHFFLEAPGIIQTIKDNIGEWKGQGKYIFLLENDKKIPPVINRNLTYIEYGLPDREAILTKLQFIAESAQDNELDVFPKEEHIKELLIDSAMGLTTQQAEDAFALSIIRNNNFQPDVIAEIKAAEYLKSGIMELESPQPIEDFQGYNLLQDYILSIKNSFQTQSKFNLPPPKGILLVGVPGTGKTLASKAIASVFNLMLLKVDIGKVFSEYVGASERGMRQLIQASERMAPIVLRIDEIEKQLGGMGGNSNSDSGVGSRVLAPFLSWLQDRKEAVFIVATANNIESLRPELLRKGRFDEIFFLDLPNNVERCSILLHHLSKRVSEFDWKQITLQNDEVYKCFNECIIDTLGWSGAEIEQIVIQTLRKYDKISLVFSPIETLYTLLEEINKTVPLSVMRKEDIDKIRNWAVENNARLASENKEIATQQETNRKRVMIK